MSNIIEKTYTIPFAPYRVFGAWTSSDAVIPPAKRLEIEARPGGQLKIYTDDGDGDPVIEGEFRKVKENRFLQYSWKSRDDSSDSLVNVAFAPAPGGTAVILAHKGVEDDAQREQLAKGWDSYVDGLKTYLSAFNSQVAH